MFVRASKNTSDERQTWQRLVAALVGCFLIFNAAKLFSQTTFVPLDHRVYRYLERQEAKHVFRHGLLRTRPLTRMQVAGYLAEIHHWLEQGHQLHPVEQKQLNFLNNEFHEELSKFLTHSIECESKIGNLFKNRLIKKCTPDFVYRNQRNMLSWREEHVQVWFDPIFARSAGFSSADSSREQQRSYAATHGVRLRGNIGSAIGFWVDVRDTKEWGAANYPLGNYTLPGLGFVRATSPDHVYHDETEAYLAFNYRYFGLVFGKFKNDWGPAYRGGLILSDNATSYDQLRLEWSFARFRFTSVYGFLIDYHKNDMDILQEKKYLAAHRLELAPWPWLNIGLSETVMFKGRSFEPAYLNPVMFFRSAEHYLGSPDNMMIGLDLTLNLVKNLTGYGELLIDDITTTRLGTDWYGNKLAYIAGLSIVDPFRLPNSEFRMEYARLRPYLYTHDSGIDYSHYGTQLGHWLNPNSDGLYAEWGWQATASTRCSVFAEFQRHGANQDDRNVGGAGDQAHGETDALDARFLDGELEKKMNYGARFSHEIIEGMFFKIELENARYETEVSNEQFVAEIQVALTFNFSETKSRYMN